MERLVESDPVVDVVAMAMMLYSFHSARKTYDAFVVFPGQGGEHWRIIEAVREWDKRPSYSARFLLIAGDIPNTKGRIALTPENLEREPFSLIPGGDCCLYTQVEAAHTKDQAEWVRQKTIELGIQSVLLFISPYHLLRSYCTLLKTYEGFQGPLIYPKAVAVSPSLPIPENGLTSWELVPGEVQRILKYQSTGDVATKDELAAHLDRLWREELMSAP